MTNEKSDKANELKFVTISISSKLMKLAFDKAEDFFKTHSDGLLIERINDTQIRVELVGDIRFPLSPSRFVASLCERAEDKNVHFFEKLSDHEVLYKAYIITVPLSKSTVDWFIVARRNPFNGPHLRALVSENDFPEEGKEEEFYLETAQVEVNTLRDIVRLVRSIIRPAMFE